MCSILIPQCIRSSHLYKNDSHLKSFYIKCLFIGGIFTTFCYLYTRNVNKIEKHRKGVLMMTQVMTKDYVNQIQFYQMPKSFFHSPKYMSMGSESKLAYMLLLDLLPLSIKNNWVNDNNEVFVKLSREKLMALLNIKGTQKAAKVMKELVDSKLIIYKKIGLTKCNEIYLYPVEGSGRKEPDSQIPTPQDYDLTQQKPQETQSLEASNTGIRQAIDLPIPTDQLVPHQLSPAESLQADIDEVEALLEDQIHIGDLKQKYDPGFVEEIGNNICEMFLNTSTPIGKQEKPMIIMRGVIRKLKMHHIEHVIDQFIEASAKIKIFNHKKYIQTMIYNSIYEAQTRVIWHIGHHFGY